MIAGIVLASVWFGSTAAPGDPNVAIDGITSYPEAVTLRSDRYPTSVSYRVVVGNHTTNALNRSFYSGSISVDGSATTDASIELQVYAESGTVSSCTQSAPTNIQCVLGDGGYLAPGTGAAFWVTVNAPTAGALMTLTSTFGGDEGKGGGNGCCDTVATTDTTLVDPLSGDNSFKRNARTFVPSAGAVLFTGVDQVATADDPWVTIVTVPTVTTGLSIDGGAPLPFTTATIAEALVLSSCGSYALAQG
ncbi:MAG TPA: hypothetical protein VFZ28_09905, partial [Burkholderiaceae bacterium]|nr:hypothetical protein [Burkholderiaceae bacterium]